MALEPPDWRAVADTLAAAFSDDPVLRWVLPDDRTRRRRLVRYFGIEARAVVLPHGCSVATGDGVCLVLPPGAWRTPVPTQLRHSAGFTRAFGWRLPWGFSQLA